ncbi:hypothetical protein RclHR1_24670001 [Rhizophagus clarus]|uniref:Uncharacterized protein n=1 Tax=Rhizophagus clarus TaxID=94130 RepID=A0A2Z6QYA7_9GLOM|nr:hypothetical protein RclHR1_24670001 [Rhizophagus clarus]
MSGKDPINLLYRIFFFNAIFLGLRGGEHFNLQFQNFIRRKDKYDRFDDIIYKSKTNQHGANDIESQGDKLYIPEIPSIIEMYENYFAKCAIQADPHFYLKLYNISEVEFNEQWYHKYERPETKIQRNNTFNLVEAFESMEQSKILILSTNNFVVAKSLLNDNRKVTNSNIEATRKPLKDLNKIQENKSQNLEELVSKLTADKVFINSVVIFNNNLNSHN